MRSCPLFIKTGMALLLCIALSACGEAVTPFPSTPTLQFRATVTAATQTATKPLPTSTPRPTITATPHPPKETRTPEPQAMLTEQADDHKATQVTSFPLQCDDLNLYYTSLSPNGTWVATACGYSHDQTLEIANKTGKHWVLKLVDFLTKNYVVDGQTGMGQFLPMHWTTDEAYLYFAPRLGFSGGGTCFYYDARPQGLYRIDVNSGFVSAVLPTTEEPASYQIAFSPVGGKVAYIGNRLTILDLRTGENVEIDTKGNGKGAVGNLTWSPDGTELAFGTCQIMEDYSAIQKSNVTIYSLQTKNVRTVLEMEKRILRIKEWDASNRLKLVNSDEQTGEDSEMDYDLLSGIVTTPTPTMQP